MAEAFGRAEAHSFALPDIAADQDAGHIADSLSEVDPDRHEVVTGTGMGSDTTSS